MKEPEWVERAIFRALTENAELAAALGQTDKKGNRTFKIYPLVIPQGTKLPCIVFQRLYSDARVTLSGYQSEMVTVQVTAFSQDFEEVQTLAGLVRKVMAGAPFKGLFQGDGDAYDPDSKTYIKSADFVCEQLGGYCYG